MLRDPRLGPPPNFSNHLISHFFQITATFSCLFVYLILQGDTSGCAKPPVDFKGKVPFWPGLAWASLAKAELLFWSQREVLHNLMCHPVLKSNLVTPIKYRVTQHVVTLVVLTTKQKWCVSKRSIYHSATFVFMSTGGWQQCDVSACR